ncbi:MAG: threonine/serine exporter family protein [Clostridia bacterium]|nr:threonine/serine exporter family protein [Clostridia bacterium]
MIEQTLIGLAGAFFGTVGFAVLTRVPRRTLIPAGGIASLVYMVYLLLTLAGFSEYSAVFFGTLLGSVLGHFCARKTRVINTVFLMSAIVPVVPGLGLYRMMASLGQGQMAQGAAQGVRAMIVIAMTALGLILGSLSDRILHRQKQTPPR